MGSRTQLGGIHIQYAGIEMQNQALSAVAAGKTDAILMASGYSRRFGEQNKLLHPFAGLPLAEHTLRLASHCGLFRRVFFVYAHPAVGQLGGQYPVTAIPNQNPGRGSCESIRLGVLASAAEYYLFMQCDQPLLTTEVLSSLLACKKPGYIVVPTCNNTPASPVLYSAAFRSQLLSLQDGQPAKSIIQNHPAQVIYAPIQNPLWLKDIDTPEDIAALEVFGHTKNIEH